MQTSDADSAQFLETGWCRFGFDAELAAWVEAALPAARRAVADPRHAQWLRCGGTWFAGVNALENDATGAVSGGPPLTGRAVDFIQALLGPGAFEWEPAQVSVCYPGYPRPMASETGPAFQYRLKRDAAHVDGLTREGQARRRHLREHHGFLLGIPMVEASPDASPFVVWEGSHEIMRETFQALFADLEPQEWGAMDATDAYHAARRRAFDSCRRVEVPARPGEAYLVHRLALHGVAPWGARASAGPDGRMIAYFRPEVGGAWDWVNAP